MTSLLQRSIYNKTCFRFTVSDFSSIPDTDRILHLGREDTRNKTVGRYYCDANQFFFSHGLKWAVKRPDDKIEFLHESKKCIISYWLDGYIEFMFELMLSFW